VVDIAKYVERKAAVFDNHLTQFKDRPFFQSFLRYRGGKEHFHLAIDRAARASRELPLR
jgi:LmbE family N-acetylglucosaminyl deacetylase